MKKIFLGVVLSVMVVFAQYGGGGGGSSSVLIVDNTPTTKNTSSLSSSILSSFNFVGSSTPATVDLNCEDKESKYTTIAGALSHANSGDTIKICKGDYSEAVTIDGINNLTITNGKDADSPSDIDWYSSGDTLTVKGNTEKLTVENLSIKSTASDSNYKNMHIMSAKDKITFENLILDTSNGASGIYFENNVDNDLEGNFKDLNITSKGQGIYINKGNKQEFDDVNVTMTNTNTNYYGIYLGDNVQNENHSFKNLTFSLKKDSAIKLNHGKDMNFEGINITATDFTDNTEAISLQENISNDAKLKFKNITIDLNAGVGININKAKDTKFENITIKGSSQWAIWLMDNVTGKPEFKNITIEANKEGGIKIQKGENVKIETATITGIDGNGFAIWLTDNVTNNHEFKDTNITTNAQGVLVEKGDKLDFENITIQGNANDATYYGIHTKQNVTGTIEVKNCDINVSGKALYIEKGEPKIQDSRFETRMEENTLHFLQNVSKVELKDSCIYKDSDGGNAYGLRLENSKNNNKIENNCFYKTPLLENLAAADTQQTKVKKNYWDGLTGSSYNYHNVTDNDPLSSCSNSCGGGSTPTPPPTCNPQNGLILSTYNISDYSNHYPNDHDEYNSLETDYATDSKLFGSGIIDTIDTTGSNNNPYHSGTDEKYLSIFDGYIDINSSGDYSFAINGDDAVEVTIGNNYYGWYGGHGSDGTDHNKIFTLEAGYHTIKFRHQEWTGGDNYQLYWKKPGDNDYSIVPKDVLYHCALPKPIADYHMDECRWEGISDEVGDYSGNDYNGTAKLGASTVDNSGGGIERNGQFSNNYVDLSKFPHLNSSRTITSWINTSDKTIKGQRVFADDEDDNDGSYALSVGDGGTGKVRFYIRGLLAVSLDSDAVVENDKWYFVVATFDADTMEKKLYVYDDSKNLLSEVSATVSGTIGTPTGVPTIGGETNSGESKNRFKGYIDEVKIFEQALSKPQIETILKNEKDGKNYDGTNREALQCSGGTQPDNNSTFNAVSSGGNNAVSDWDNNLTTQIVKKPFSIYILSKDQGTNLAEEANITKVVFNFYNAGNENKCSGTSYANTLICDDNTSNLCPDTNSSGEVKIPNIIIAKASKCIEVYIKGRDINNTSTDDNESNASNDFAIRPKDFNILQPTGTLYAGEDFSISFEARNDNNVNTTDYNESKSNNSFVVEYNETKVGCITGTLNLADFNFTDGSAQNINTNYSEIGDVNITMKDSNDSHSFAYVDHDDTNDNLRLIAPSTIQIKVQPYELNITKLDFTVSTGADWLYMADSINDMNITLPITIKAFNKQDTVLKDFNSTCYAKDVNVTFYYTTQSSETDVDLTLDGNLTDTSHVNISYINKTLQIPKGLFKDGEANSNYAFGIDRAYNEYKNPKNVKLNEANVTSTGISKYRGGKTVDKNATFYYGRTYTQDLTTSKSPDTTKVKLLVYADKAHNSYVSGYKEELLNWYLNTKHTDAKFGDINDSVPSKSTQKTQTAEITTSIGSIANGVSVVEVNTTSNTEGTYFIHLGEDRWLWYVPKNFGSDYNYSDSSDCSAHPCIKYNYEKENDSNQNGVSSGNHTGVQFDVNISKNNRGVRLLR